MPSFSRTTTSAAETHLLGIQLGRVLRAGDVVLLEGTLGAGKTALVRGAAEGLGLDTGAVASPTYVIMHEYTQSAAAEAKATGPGADRPPDLPQPDPRK